MQSTDSVIEKIKKSSNALRGAIEEGLHGEISGAIAEEDQALIKFHGIYQQDDRDRRQERAEKKLENQFSFMVRLRLPAGVLSGAQWAALHHIAGAYATGIVKITSRQTLQLHGIAKSDLKPTVQNFNLAQLDSIATCGDVNRNVTCTSDLSNPRINFEITSLASKISKLLMPKSNAYYEIFLDREPLLTHAEEDPLYQDRYLPRKFKIAVALPPHNDVDVFTNDIGLIAIVEQGHLIGYNIAVGGGLSTTHGNPNTYPRLGTLLGYVPVTDGEENILKTIYQIVCIQRDYGNRSDRKLARLKYTLDSMGVDAFLVELEKRIGFPLQERRAYVFKQRKDDLGWGFSEQSGWHFTLFVENGRVMDSDKLMLKTALLKISETKKCNFRFTCNQNLMLTDIAGQDQSDIKALIHEYGLDAHNEITSEVRKNAMACVALNTCPLALAEGQRYMPSLVDKVENILTRCQLGNEEIIIRLTGCPNGCSRPYAAEIGLVGTSYGHYNVLIGGDRSGFRLNTLYKENLDERGILDTLESLFSQFKREKDSDEHFGDFVTRKIFMK